jgi:hypothetical protein
MTSGFSAPSERPPLRITRSQANDLVPRPVRILASHVRHG